MKKCLNIGCGRRYHLDWTNIDVYSDDPNVRAHDITRGLPFDDDRFEVVYHSHVLEHLTRHQAAAFLRECHRVLTPGGVIRVAVPDLEGIVRTYLGVLERVCVDEKGEQANYDWMVLELYDQVLRNKSGGEMADYLLAGAATNKEFLLRRLGTEAKHFLDRTTSGTDAKRDHEGGRPSSFLAKVAGKLFSPGEWRRLLARLVLGKEFELYEIGKFRRSGEVHQWMYDRYSMMRALENAGFGKIVHREADTSYIDGWTDFQLDTEKDGQVYKPDSLYMEGMKTLA